MNCVLPGPDRDALAQRRARRGGLSARARRLGRRGRAAEDLHRRGRRADDRVACRRRAARHRAIAHRRRRLPARRARPAWRARPWPRCATRCTTAAASCAALRTARRISTRCSATSSARNPDRDALVLGAERISLSSARRRRSRLSPAIWRGAAFAKATASRCCSAMASSSSIAVLAAARVGIIVVPMSTRQRAPETEFILTQCEAAGLIYQGDLAEHLPAPRCAAASARVLRRRRRAGHAVRGADGALRRRRASRSPRKTSSRCSTRPAPPAARRARCSRISASSIRCCTTSRAWRCATATSRCWPCRPRMSPAWSRSSLDDAARRRLHACCCRPSRRAHFIELAARERMTHALLVPAMYNLCLLDPELRALRSLGAGASAASAARRCRRRRSSGSPRACPDLTLVNVYGSTETTSPVDDDAARRGRGARRHGRHGPALRRLIAMDDDGREVAAGASGELWIGGPMVVPGYWRQPGGRPRRRSAAATGTPATSARSTREAIVRVFDRKKDMINRGGYKVYCVEVENVLCASSRRDRVRGHRRARPGARRAGPCRRASRATRASGRGVAALLRRAPLRLQGPGHDHLLPDALPRNANGKVQKTALRETLPPPPGPA